MSDQKTVLWPDLTRFGASLTVANNPTAGANFLKLTVWDRDLFAANAALPVGADLIQIMRDAGFAYAVSETKSKAHAAYDLSVREGASVAATDIVRQAALKRLYFYSAAIVVKKSVLQQFVPGLKDDDFKQMAIAEVKHLDHEYVDADQQAQMFLRQRAGRTFYTTSEERTLAEATVDSRVTVNELLCFKDFPPERLLQRADHDAALAKLARFRASPFVENIMVGQTLSPSGLPLKAIRPAATLAVYTTRSDAVAANGGDEAGVEGIVLDHALPIAFEHDSKRVLLLKDARFIEVPNLVLFQQQVETAPDISAYWKFGEVLAALQAIHASGKHESYFDVSRWDDREFFEEVEQYAMQVLMAQYEIPASLKRHEVFVDQIDVRSYAGQRQELVDELYTPEFLSFLDDCRNVFSPAWSAKRAEYAAAAVVEKGVEAAKRVVKQRESARAASSESGTDKRMDAGVKIGGARKDYAKRFLTLAEVSELTDREMVEVVTKDNVWPPLNYEQMRADGVPPEIAYAIKELRRRLAVNPLKAGYNRVRSSIERRISNGPNERICSNFVRAVTVVRDQLMSVRDGGSLTEAILEIRKQGELSYWEEVEQGRSRCVGLLGVNSDDWFPDGTGYKFARELPDVTVRADRVESSDVLRLLHVARSKTEGKWDWAIKSRDEEVTASGEDEAKATGKKERPEPPVRHLEKIERQGPDTRAGVDVDESMLLNVFGFKGCEYGNWLKNAERQLVLNHAFDAFMDLSRAIGLPPRAMSLGGELSIAFGSRGRGGRSAAMAHYEPGRNVINLTRMMGAGSLSHEWGHAFDYWLAKVSGLSKIKPVSEVLADGKYSGKAGPAWSLNELLWDSRKRPLSKEEVLAAAFAISGKGVSPGDKTSFDHTLRCLRNWARGLDYRLPVDKRNDVFMQFANESIDACFIDDPQLGEHGIKAIDNTSNLVDSLIRALTLQAGAEAAKGIDVKYPSRVFAWYATKLSNARQHWKSYVAGVHCGKSNFLEDAEYFDGYRSKPYWSTRVETFARAFESFVQEEIESTPGEVSQYLVHSTNTGADAQHAIYPRGAEREEVVANFKAFFKANRLELCRMMDLDENALIARAFSDQQLQV